MRNKLFLPLLLATSAAYLVGCATPPPPPPVAKESVILLPQENGQPSAVVVKSAGQEVVLDKPYMTASFDEGKIVAGETSPEAVTAQFADLIAADPPGPKQFLLFYEVGDIKMTAESMALFEQVKAELSNYPAGEVVVIAHTDRTGSVKSNDQLSMRRAESVRALLIGIGIPADIIQVAGRGEHEPLVPTKDGVAEAQNRRVEIKVR